MSYEIALKLIEPRYHEDFKRLLREGEEFSFDGATPGFLDYVNANEEIMDKATTMILGDQLDALYELGGYLRETKATGDIFVGAFRRVDSKYCKALLTCAEKGECSQELRDYIKGHTHAQSLLEMAFKMRLECFVEFAEGIHELNKIASKGGTITIPLPGALERAISYLKTRTSL